jgi:hypothetical protein
MAEFEESTETLLPNQVSTLEYLTKLSLQDRANLDSIRSRYRKILEERGQRGNLIVVGGSIDKPLPRKDIDVLVITEKLTSVSDENKTGIEKAKYDFDTNFKPIIEVVAPEEDGFKTQSVFEPAVDEEYQNPNLLKHDGTILVTKDRSTPIEFIRNSQNSDLKAFAGNAKRSWVLLS